MQPKLYILVGLPYSGKTTLRRKLIEKYGFDSLSIDEIMDGHDMWREDHPTQEDWNDAYTEAYATLKSLLKEGKSVVFDVGNLTLHERQTARKIAGEIGVGWMLVYINTPLEEIKRRRLANLTTKERGHLDDDSMEKALQLFEQPTVDENPIEYDSTMDFETWSNQYVG